jgi:hypothetical protein
MPDLGIGEAVAGLADVFTGGDLRRAWFKNDAAACGSLTGASASGVSPVRCRRVRRLRPFLLKRAGEVGHA